MATYLFVTGGSGGHLYPLVAVMQAVQEREPDSTCVLVCANTSQDLSFLRELSLRPQATLPRLRASLLLPITFLVSLGKSLSLIRAHRPAAVFTKGGSVSIPLCLAAKMSGIPIVLHESDAVMGRANRFIAKMATTSCLGLSTRARGIGFSLFSRSSKKKSSCFAGNPVRQHIRDGERSEGLRITRFSGEKPVLLVMGGSQGAQVLNEWVVAHLAELSPVADVIHLVGKRKKGASKQKGYFCLEYAGEEIAHLYALSDVAVSRSGASSITELAATYTPGILLPLEGLAQNHQVRNAEIAEQSGGFVMVRQDRMESDLLPEVLRLLQGHHAARMMGQQAHMLYKSDAAEKIAEEIVRAAEQQSVRAARKK